MTQRTYVAGLSLFAVLTIGLIVNLTSFQKGQRELAPVPLALISQAPQLDFAKPDSGDLVILNSISPVENLTVSKIQRELASFGYQPGKADGNDSLMTRAAAMAYEYDNGLPLTAALDDGQLKRLLLGAGRTDLSLNGKAGTPATPAATHVMRVVQKSLAKLGYGPGKADGTYSLETERAIRNIETDYSLPETGRVSGRLIERLSQLESRGKMKVTQR